MPGRKDDEDSPKLSVDNVGARFARAVMLDVAAAKGVPMLDVGYEITVADLDAAMRIGRGLAARPGIRQGLLTRLVDLFGGHEDDGLAMGTA